MGIARVAYLPDTVFRITTDTLTGTHYVKDVTEDVNSVYHQGVIGGGDVVAVIQWAIAKLDELYPNRTIKKRIRVEGVYTFPGYVNDSNPGYIKMTSYTILEFVNAVTMTVDVGNTVVTSMTSSTTYAKLSAASTSYHLISTVGTVDNPIHDFEILGGIFDGTNQASVYKTTDNQKALIYLNYCYNVTFGKSTEGNNFVVFNGYNMVLQNCHHCMMKRIISYNSYGPGIELIDSSTNEIIHSTIKDVIELSHPCISITASAGTSTYNHIARNLIGNGSLWVSIGSSGCAGNIVEDNIGYSFGTVDTQVPGPPTLISATPGDAQVVLVWSAPTTGGTATGYDIYRGTTSGGETLFTTLGNVTTYTNTGLTNGMTYYYKVSATNTVGEGTKSNELSGIPAGPGTMVIDQELPTAALNEVGNNGTVYFQYRVHIGEINQQGIALQWWRSGNVGAMNTFTTGADGKVTFNFNSGGWAAPTPPGTNWIDDFWVQTVDGLTKSPVVHVIIYAGAIPIPGPPSAPTLSVAAGNAQNVLTWTAAAPNGYAVTDYKVYSSTTSGGEVLLLDTYSTSLTYTHTGLTNGTTYYYKVSATNSQGEGALSVEQSGTPSEPSGGNPKYIVYSGGGVYHYQNYLTGVISSEYTSANSCITAAINQLTSGRSSKEKIRLQGNSGTGAPTAGTFNLTGQITLPSYTILDGGTSTIYLASGAYGVYSSSTTYVDVIGGVWDGGGSSSIGIYLVSCSYFIIQGCEIRNSLSNNTNGNGIDVQTCTYGTIDNNYCHNVGRMGILVALGCKYIDVTNNRCYWCNYHPTTGTTYGLAGGGIYLWNNVNATLEYIKVQNNRVIECSADGISVYPNVLDTANVNNCWIDSNTIINTSYNGMNQALAIGSGTNGEAGHLANIIVTNNLVYQTGVNTLGDDITNGTTYNGAIGGAFYYRGTGHHIGGDGTSTITNWRSDWNPETILLRGNRIHNVGNSYGPTAMTWGHGPTSDNIVTGNICDRGNSIDATHPSGYPITVDGNLTFTSTTINSTTISNFTTHGTQFPHAPEAVSPR